MKTTKKCCSFCGRSENEVRLLINGLHGYICEECAVQAYNIVKSTGLMELPDEDELPGDAKPSEA